MKPDSLTELQIKASVLNHLVANEGLAGDAIVIYELPLGTTAVRADLVILHANNKVCGIEIKSDRDRLTRLERQLTVYQDYFDRVIVVFGPKHAGRALKSELHGLDVWLANHDHSIEMLKASVANQIAVKAGRELLTKKQAKSAVANGRLAYCDALRQRFDQTSAEFWRATTRRSIKPDDLRLLSRFGEAREQAAKIRAQRETMWAGWSEFFANQKSVHSSSVS